ncbi:pilus assembly protein [Kitasatospora sp. NBC_01287]|uniref:TadE family type IV pilus minor pilin n=1 Tax=Kitasatospora sp. NBC_01287 TaxID=2903573 RepID=UPI00225246D8|nr:TadE family type IV pilus minor pilin [Kitasatospora sp. NBC_01287]MCX4748128.1 pilus assembly protein [Kitasatospora sp. NBC_01287]
MPRSALTPRRGVRDAGYVTAETAVVLPTFLLLTTVLIWGVLTAAAQLRCIDAARAGARSAARGDGDAVARAQAVAPRGATVEVAENADTVQVLVEAECLGPGRLAAALSMKVSARAEAIREDRIGREPE